MAVVWAKSPTLLSVAPHPPYLPLPSSLLPQAEARAAMSMSVHISSEGMWMSVDDWQHLQGTTHQ